MGSLSLVCSAALVFAAGCGTDESAPSSDESAPSSGDREPAAAAATQVEVDELSIAELGARMKSGELSSRALVAHYLARIEALNPRLRAVIETNPDAIAIAERLDEQRAAGKVRGPLHGIPVLLKDNIATADNTETTAGSLALVGARPTSDAFVAARLRDAGAVLLGKANLSEWANFRSTKSSSGWSARGGQTRNPYVLDRNPCGSSSGSGVAVSANMVSVAIGTETDGSIVCPSSANGIVGIRPTVGLVSAAGIVPISHSQDTAGPMARTVTDAAVVLSALVEGKDYAASLKADALGGARIGVWRARWGKHPAVDRVMDAAIESMRAAGAVIVDIELEAGKALGDAEFEVLLYEFKFDLNQYLGQLSGNGPKTLAALIEFNEQNAAKEMPHFGQELLLLAQSKAGLDDPVYIEARDTARRLAGAEGIDRVVAEHKLDAIVAPTGGPAWTTDHVNGDHFTLGSSTPAAVAGYPNVTVPAGFVRGLPVGMSLFGPARTEARLIALAYAFEQATKARKPPQMLPTLAD